MSSLIAAYREQQRRVLQGVIVEGEPSAGHSTGSELAERRKTASMYLLHQTGATALAVAGLVTLFWLGGSLQGIQALALWIFCTGALSLLLSAWQHRQELRLSPENIELERLEHVAYLGEYDAATRRRILLGELRLRQAARAQQEQEAERLQAQLERRRTVQRQPIPIAEPTVMQTVSIPSADCPSTVTPLLETLLQTVAALYDVDPDGAYVRISHDGRIDERLPWSARGELPPAEKERVQIVLGCLNPPLIEQRAGGRYYLNTRSYPMQLALKALRAAWQ